MPRARQDVELGRREWERLRVPDHIANEMAADLAADLEQAEAEGVSAEEVLGRSAFDPRSFATSWAAERGVIPPAAHQESASPLATERGVIPSAGRPESASSKPLMLAGLAILTVIGLIGAALIALAGHSESVAIAPQHRVSLAPPAPVGPFVLHRGPVAAEALAWVLLLLVVTLGTIVSVWLWSRSHRSRPPTAPA
jgi:hypothetical protein